MTRPSWDETLMALVDVWARRATCPRLSVGAVVANDARQVLASGFNGAPRGLPHCDDEGCLLVGGHCLRAVHAEHNAILMAARLGIPLLGATMYTSYRPCPRCSLAIVQAGIAEVVHRGTSTGREDAHGTLERAGVRLRVVAAEAA